MGAGGVRRSFGAKGVGGGSGGSTDQGTAGNDAAGGNASGTGTGANDDQKAAQGAPDKAKYPECGFVGHPVDVVTGRAFTHEITDLALPGPLPLVFQRMYSSKMAGRDTGLGYGWAHTFGWEIELRRREIRVWNEQGIAVDFPVIEPGGEILGPWGWLLRRDAAGIGLDADDGRYRTFGPTEDPKRFRLEAIEDRNRNRIAIAYEDGHLARVTDSAGRTVRIQSVGPCGLKTLPGPWWLLERDRS